MFGWPYAKRTTAFEESLDILGLAWRGERFDYEGRVYKVKVGPAAAAAGQARRRCRCGSGRRRRRRGPAPSAIAPACWSRR